MYLSRSVSLSLSPVLSESLSLSPSLPELLCAFVEDKMSRNCHYLVREKSEVLSHGEYYNGCLMGSINVSAVVELIWAGVVQSIIDGTGVLIDGRERGE